MDIEEPAEGDLVSRLAALASHPRLALMKELRTPKVLAEIDLRSPRPTEASRPLTRQTISTHLEPLLRAGIVVARPVNRPFGATQEFVVNHQATYALSEEVRRLARTRPLRELMTPTTQATEDVLLQAARPALVLVRGLDEGTEYSIAPKRGKSSWLIGRSRDADIALDYDAAVSSENAILDWDGKHHHIRDVPGSRNGTLVNFTPLKEGDSRRLAHGDLISVGRSALLFWR